MEATELDSSKTYTLDTTQSTCTYKDGTEIPDLNISYDSETRRLSINPFTTKGTKCTLYFDEYVESVRDTLLANYPTQLTRSDFSTTVTNITTGTIYYKDTSKGKTYYFAGNPTDNWIRWAGFYWRIIRINEDGSLRLIYQGTSNTATGRNTQIGISDFSRDNLYNNNMYVGYIYQSGQVHGLTTDSLIKDTLDTWYTNNLSKYADDLDGNAGFCGDRTPYTNESGTSSGGGTGTTTTYYGASIRLNTNKVPTFECENDSDLYTTSGSEDGNGALIYPIGLITADEVAYAGGVYVTSNTSYYLYTGMAYWTLSPRYFNSGNAYVFIVDSYGVLLHWSVVGTSLGVRPVINLKSNVTISSGDGTASNPYIVN